MKQKLVVKNKGKIKDLIDRLAEAEETIEAIKHNRVDALLIETPKGEEVYTLKDSERPYRVFLEKINEGALTISRDGNIIFANQKFAELLQVPLELIVGSSILKWTAISDLNNFTAYLNVTNENSLIELNLLNTEGSLIPVSVSIAGIDSEDMEQILCLVVTDLTQQKQHEQIIKAEKLARSIIEQTSEAIIVCDENLKIIRASKGAEILAGINLLNEKFDSVFHFKNDNINNILIRDVVNSALPFQGDILYIGKTGEYFNLVMNVGILTGPQESILGYIISLTNVTHHMRAEEKISASLNEKTILLKEIHHRVKNNLQIVSSLLNIQASYIKDPEVKIIFDECQHRINSMALIHQKLYESKSFSEINIADYLMDLTGFLCSTYLFNSNKVTFNYSVKNIYFSTESAIPLGLIMNELITNCIKHAFKNKDDGEITVSLYSETDKVICVSVKDNGIGFPQNIDISNPVTLGLQLVNTLTEQINGSVKVKSIEGTEFIITVPIS